MPEKEMLLSGRRYNSASQLRFVGSENWLTRRVHYASCVSQFRGVSSNDDKKGPVSISSFIATNKNLI